MKLLSAMRGFIILLSLASSYANAAPLFNTSLSGYTISVTPTVNHNYTEAGIKISSANNQPVSGCTPNANGYCIFSTSPQHIDVQGNIYAGTDAGIYLSTNNGASWSTAFGPTIHTCNPSIFSLYVNNGSIYVGAADNQLYVSSDGGTTWVATNYQPDGSNVLSLTLTNSN